MAQLGRLEFTIQDTLGNASPNASVEVRKQGAQVNGAQAGSPYTVDDIGGIIVGDTVKLNTGSTTRNVSAISATTLTTSGGDLGAVSDDDRITCVTLPTVYEDALGNTARTNPLTTDANGFASCYVVGGKYDVLITVGGVSILRQDVVAGGGESVLCNIYFTGSATAYKLDTLRAAAAGDKLLDVQTAGASKFSVAGDGEIVAGAAGATHALTGNTAITGTLTSSGALTVSSGGAAITGNMTVTGTIKNPSTRIEIDGTVASGAAILGAVMLNSVNSLAGATDNIVVVYNAGISTFYITKDGDIAPRALGPLLTSGNGAPGALVLPKGTIYMRTDGAVGSTCYVSQGAGTWNAVAGV